jgi:hypothetical protein
MQSRHAIDGRGALCTARPSNALYCIHEGGAARPPVAPRPPSFSTRGRRPASAALVRARFEVGSLGASGFEAVCAGRLPAQHAACCPRSRPQLAAATAPWLAHGAAAHDCTANQALHGRDAYLGEREAGTWSNMVACAMRSRLRVARCARPPCDSATVASGGAAARESAARPKPRAIATRACSRPRTIHLHRFLRNNDAETAFSQSRSPGPAPLSALR